MTILKSSNPLILIQTLPLMHTTFQELRIIFMGTPDFAVASLDRLVSAGANIVAVVTAPDKPAGRGLALQQSAVKKYAVEKNIPSLQPHKLKDPAFLEELRQLDADLQIVVAFRMLPEVVWNMPPFGTINLHGSLLPQYRGAAPINWAIINGEKYTGVTTFKLKHEIDTGDILLQDKIEIGETETAGELHDRMKEIGADLLVRTLQFISKEGMQIIPQEELITPAVEIRHAPKIFTDTCAIDWNKPVDDVYNFIRGLSPYPAAYTQIDNKQVKIFSIDKMHETPGMASGEIKSDRKTYLRFACTDGYIDVKELQVQGKKKLAVAEFLRGWR